MAKQRIADLKECLATYGDEDGALQALIERTGQVTNETAEKLWSDIDAKNRGQEKMRVRNARGTCRK